MIVLFTDFGYEGPYVGQMKAVLAQQAPGVSIVDLMHDVPTYNPRAAAYLFAQLVDEFPLDTVFVGVVDPGVGDPARRAVVLRADGRWYVGPDNGLFAVLATRARSATWWEITWQPLRLSNTFHGRDLFVPMAAHIAACGTPEPRVTPIEAGAVSDWPADLYEIIYIDRFGNAVTGIRAEAVDQNARVKVGGRTLNYANTFSAVPRGEAFWYANSSGLVEIAVNGSDAHRALGIAVGNLVEASEPNETGN
ncbi:MAG: SAM-dependent chlorinase/fluorinase [Pseudomonadota bacterium]|nr:MAG: SAM-dependent chlorinase/fluorinase [Pseudomonadota bacterium]